MPSSSEPESAGQTPVFRAPYAEADEALAGAFLQTAPIPAAEETASDSLATKLIAAIRNRDSAFGGVEDILHEYSLSTREGVALMMLAEALLRVPDEATADKLIEDKITDADWAHYEIKSDSLLVSASAWGLALAARIVGPGDTPRGILAAITRRLGLPAVRAATRRAIGVVATHFVLGETIEEALAHANSRENQRQTYSFDMLGEGARTAADATRYFDAYAHAIDVIGRRSSLAEATQRPGISVKLSALHPRFEAISRERVMGELPPRLLELARKAKDGGLDLTVDAEEADRLELSLEVIAKVFADRLLRDWDGFGFAVQSYQKRATAVIDYAAGLADSLGRRIKLRLVKGAYWDSEIKRAQERGLDDYPVFTRKAMTDLNYMACARRLLEMRRRVFPQFATHNALTVATLLQTAGDKSGFEYQRLHGMGEDLYAALADLHPEISCRVYAPVGSHRDLLAYLVRRLLENGANSSFVSRVADPSVDIGSLLERPKHVIGTASQARHPRIPLPRDIFGAQRKNSRGVEFGCSAALAGLLAEIEPWRNRSVEAYSLIDGEAKGDKRGARASPIDGAIIGGVREASTQLAARAVERASLYARTWEAKPVEERAGALDLAADLIETQRGQFIALLQAEGGKTLDDALSEVREAVDYCRYYALEARRLFRDVELPGPAGEDNILRHRGRGVFVCISPWNFPLAIFLGQVVAALVSGNCVVAKPAEQTPLIAFEAVKLLHSAGVAKEALQLVLGDGAIGAALVQHAHVAGVAFTGSTDVALKINRALAAKDGPIAPLVAETGGINAMIADATAVPEQLVDDVVTSAFRSAGQRCSALRLLCLQEDIADQVLDMIAGAANEMRIGDPREPAVHIGPVIDAGARAALTEYVATLGPSAKILHAGRAPVGGLYFAPHIVELGKASDLRREVFGPVLHVVRWSATDPDMAGDGGLPDLLEEIDAQGYGLTLGVHSRIEDTVKAISERLRTGNIYVNRSMIGAVVGSQPFGGNGLSGTGPKAGGPGYLARFTLEQTISTNSAAAGGNVSLIAEQDGWATPR